MGRASDRGIGLAKTLSEIVTACEMAQDDMAFLFLSNFFWEVRDSYTADFISFVRLRLVLHVRISPRRFSLDKLVHQDRKLGISWKPSSIAFDIKCRGVSITANVSGELITTCL